MEMPMFVACSDDDSNPESQIIGQWECTSSISTMYRLSTNEEVGDYNIKIFSEGTVLFFYEDETCCELYNENKSYYTYKINGDKIDFISNNHNLNNTYIFILSSEKIIFSYVHTDSDRDIKIICKSVFRKQ